MRRHKWISENYFATMGNPLIAGRDITWTDVHERRPVAIVSANLARELFGEPQAAVGRRIRQTPSNPWRQIVGIYGVIAALGLVALTATWIPARQATRVDPAIALRGE